MKYPLTVAALAGSLFLALSAPAPGQCEPAVLPGVSPTPYDYLGYSVAMEGGLLLLGAPSYQSLNPEPGYVEVLRREAGNWVHEARIYAPAPHDYVGNEFGFSIDFDGSRAVIGAPGLNGDAGGVFVIDRFGPGNWVFHVPYFIVGGQPGDRLGTSVSYHAPHIAAGAPGSDVVAPGSGSVMLYDVNSLIMPVAQLVNPAPQQNASFGSSVRLAAGRLFASAPRQSPDGVVYAFYGGPLFWPLEDTIVHSNPGFATTFGGGLIWESAVLGGDLWVTSTTDEVAGLPGAGAIHRFGYQPPIFPATKGTFVLAETIVSDTPTNGGRFGRGLAVDHPSFGRTRVLTGTGIYDGHGYVFERSTFWSNVFAPVRKFQHPSLQTPLRGVALDGDLAVFGTREAGNGGSLNGGAVFLDLACEPACGPRLENPDPNPGADTGYSVDVLGSMAVVGVPGDDTQGLDAGAVRIYRWDGQCWYLETTLYDELPAAGDRFGHAVAIAPLGNYVLVGAPRADGVFTDEGKVCVFWRASNQPGWLQSGALIKPSASAEAYFGFSLDIDGWTAVGAPGNGATAGAVHVYEAPGPGFPIYETTLLSPAATGDWFGYDVACEGAYVYVGNPLEDTAGTDAGEVSVHFYNPFFLGWFTWQRFRGTAAAGYRFGSALDVQGGLGVIGAPEADLAGQPRAGRAYLYSMSTGQFAAQLDALISPFVAPDETFGFDVAVFADRISVGAPAAGTGGSGTVYDFDRAGSAAVLTHVLAPTALPSEAEFGRAVGTNGLHTVIGAPGGLGASAGSAWALAGETREPPFDVSATRTGAKTAVGGSL